MKTLASPKVSIIVPNYNHAAFLSQRLDSIFNQTYKDFEVILLDDASTDNSVQILEEYAVKYKDKVTHLVVNQTNSGSPFKQWRKGIELAKGEYIWIAESDDYAASELLQILLNILSENPDAGLSYSQSIEVDENSNKVRNFHFWTDDLDLSLWKENFTLSGSTFLRYMVKKNVIPNASAVLFRKALYDEVGKIHTHFKLAGDWDLWIRLLSKAKIAYTSQCLNYFRSAHNTTRHIVSKAKKELRILEELKVLKELNSLNCIEGGLIRDQQKYLLNKWKKLYLIDFEPTLLVKNFNLFKLYFLSTLCWKGVMKFPKAISSYIKSYKPGQ